MKTALVTGAGQNIGRAVAIALGATGFNVVVNGNTNRDSAEGTAEAVRATGAQAVVAMGDVGDRATALSVADAGIAAFGRIDAMIHNAAIRPSAPFLETAQEDWDRVIDVNLSASVWLAQACLPGMVAAGWGRIVLFAGMNAIQGYNGRAATSVSKHGNWGLAKSLAKEFGPKGITANIVSPGPIESEHKDAEMTAHVRSQVGRIPAGRLGAPEEVATVVTMLCSDGGAFVNGQMLQVNGGAMT